MTTTLPLATTLLVLALGIYHAVAAIRVILALRRVVSLKKSWWDLTVAIVAIAMTAYMIAIAIYGPLRTEEAQIAFAYVPARTWHGISPNHVPEARLAVLRSSNLHVTIDGDQGDDAWKRFNPGQTVFVQYRERLAVRLGQTNVIGFRVERIPSEADILPPKP